MKLADLGQARPATALLVRLSPTALRGVMVTLRQALKAAAAWRRHSWSPATQVPMPQVLPSPMAPWTAAELSAFLATAEGDRLHPILVLLVSTGMRRGEVLGLRWATAAHGRRRPPEGRVGPARPFQGASVTLDVYSHVAPAVRRSRPGRSPLSSSARRYPGPQ